MNGEEEEEERAETNEMQTLEHNQEEEYGFEYDEEEVDVQNLIIINS